MLITKELSTKAEQEYLTFLGDIYVSSESLSKTSVDWLLRELAFTIGSIHPDYPQKKIISLLINLQKLKRIGKKKRKI